jgi:hypothetical protein
MKTRCAAVILAGFLATLSACGEKGANEVETASPWPSADARRMRPEHAPTPFTADQIREACPVGRRSTFRVEMPGRAPFLQTFHFTAADAKGAEVTFTIRDEGGRMLGEPTTSKSAWRGFQSHASYPAEQTTITEGEETLPAGTFRGFLYRVEDAETSTEAFFARDLPGPPVRMVRSREGAVELSMTLVTSTAEDG